MSLEKIIKFRAKQWIEQKKYIDDFQKEIIKQVIDRTNSYRELFFILVKYI